MRALALPLSTLPSTSLPPASSELTIKSRVASSADSNGKSVTLMTLVGNVPMTVDGEEYDVPVTVWLTDSYPLRPPPVYVTPGEGNFLHGVHADSVAVDHRAVAACVVSRADVHFQSHALPTPCRFQEPCWTLCSATWMTRAKFVLRI